MAFTTAPFPAQDAIVDRDRRPTRVFLDWTTALAGDVDASAARISTVEVEDQSASIGATAIPVGALAAGYYRVTTFARIVRAATTSSSLIVAVQFTDAAVTCTHTGAAVTGNTTGTVQSLSWLVRIDQGTPVTYTTTYASVGGTSMQYDLAIIVEQVQA
jgi:hypothetical protein